MDFCTKLGGKMHQGHADCGEDHMTKSRNRKLTRVTSSIEHLEHKCIDLIDYNRYLNKIW